MLHAVIMAGGAGTRFWPASRSLLPKQLLDLTGGRTMIQATVDRLSGLVNDNQIFIITNRQLTSRVREQLPTVPSINVIGEPCKRDTAPCIGLAAMLVSRTDPDATLLVLPADHVIKTNDQFQSAIRFAVELIQQDRSRIVTFGIRPTYPADSFGYVERGQSLNSQIGVEKDVSAKSPPLPAFQAKKFREKPSVATAKEYLASGNFYWNSGIFVWTAKTILDALRRYEPAMYQHLSSIADAAAKPDFEQVFDKEFTAIQGKSIDYAVMEHAENIIVVESTFDWDDVGNWRALSRLRGIDQEGNTIVGKHLGIRTSNSIVRSSEEHLIVTLGVDDLIIVHTPDATLVAKKDDEESLRKVVQMLNEREWTSYL